MAARFSPQVVDTLLDKLSSDDGFRSLFQKNPREALRQIGHETPEKSVGVAGSDPVMCCQSIALASKEQIKASRAHLAQKMMIFNPFMYFQADPDHKD
jgi:putative modified peptide